MQLQQQVTAARFVCEVHDWLALCWLVHLLTVVAGS